MSASRFFRYLAPNLVTSLAMLFGMLAMVRTYEGEYVAAAWLVVWAVLLDRVDGLVARTLRANSEFGVQMDSFADAFNFGIVPAFLVFVSLSSAPELGFTEGWGRAGLMASCALWVLAGVYRLAKFNVISEDGPKGLFFGVATTLAAGTLATWYVVLHKYADPQSPLGSPERFTGPKLLGDWTFGPSAWVYLPAAMVVGALLMASNLPSPKLGKSRYLALNIVLGLAVAVGFVCGFARVMPDFMALLPTIWLVVSLVWGQVASEVRGLRPPSFLPPPTPEPDDEDTTLEPVRHPPA